MYERNVVPQMPTHHACVQSLPAMLEHPPASVPDTQASTVKPVEKSNALFAGIST